MKTILVVDDDAEQVELLELIFSSKYKVLKALSMREAINVYKENEDISAVITDFFLGDGTGPNLIKALKLPPSIVTILVTGRELDVKVNGKYLNFDAYFIKPTNITMLSAALSTGLRLKGKDGIR